MVKNVAPGLLMLTLLAGRARADEPPPAPPQPAEQKPAEQKPPQTKLDFDLLGPEQKPVHVDPSVLRRRRTLLNWHQGAGIGLFGIALANTIVGQLNYSDRFASGPSTGRYQTAHKITAYATVGAFAATGLLAYLAPNPLPKTGGFDRVSAHELAMIAAGVAMAGEVALGIYTASREGYLNQSELANIHLGIGYATFAAISLGVGVIVF